MSLIDILLFNFGEAPFDFNRMESIEEQEVGKYLPDLDIFARIAIANEFIGWKSIIDTENELTFEDFVNDVYGDKKLKRKQVITDELIVKAKKSIGTTVLKPEI